MTEEMKQKKDELAELNLIKGGPEHTFLNCFQRGFDACYQLMEVENAVIRAELIQHDMDNGSSWRGEYENCKAALDSVDATNELLKSRIEKLREALEFYGNKDNWYDANAKYTEKAEMPIMYTVIASIDTEGETWLGGKTARTALKVDEVEG